MLITIRCMRDSRLTKLAEVLVNYSIGVKRGQLVRINGPVVAEPLVVEIFRAVVKAGGHPMVRMGADATAEIFFKNASDEQLGYLNPVAKYEIETIDCSIGIWADDNTKALTNCDPKRMAKNSAARRPISDIFMKRASEGKLRWSGTQFPCQASAQDAEMSLAEYEDFVFGAGLLEK